MLDLNYISNMILSYVSTNSAQFNYNNHNINMLINQNPKYIIDSINYSMMGYFGENNKIRAIMVAIYNNVLPFDINMSIKEFLYNNITYIINEQTFEQLVSNHDNILYMTETDIAEIFGYIESAMYKDNGLLLTHLMDYMISIHPDIMNLILTDFYFDEDDIKMYIKDDLAFIGVTNDIFLIDNINLMGIVNDVISRPSEFIYPDGLLNIIEAEYFKTAKKCQKDIDNTYNSESLKDFIDKATVSTFRQISIILCELFETTAFNIMNLNDLDYKLNISRIDLYSAYINTVKILTLNPTIGDECYYAT